MGSSSCLFSISSRWLHIRRHKGSIVPCLKFLAPKGLIKPSFFFRVVGGEKMLITLAVLQDLDILQGQMRAGGMEV